MKRFNKVSLDELNSIQFDAGYLMTELDVDNPIFDSSKIICATTGGINPVCVPEFYDFGEDVDNAKESKETKRIRGWETSISFTTLTTSLTMIRYALGAADISGNALTLRQKLNYAKDFKDIWWVGKRADDKLIAIRLIRSLSDSGFSLQTTKKGKGQISVTLKGHSSFAEKDKIPMEVYVFAESDVPETPDEPVTSNLYLYGHQIDTLPAFTDNVIALREGDNLTYYLGAVYGDLPMFDTGAYSNIVLTRMSWQAHWLYMYFFDTPLEAKFGGTNNDKLELRLYIGDKYLFSRTADAETPETIYLQPFSEPIELVESKDDIIYPIWSNYTIHGEDDSVFFEHTTPIRVTEFVGYDDNGIPIYEDLR